MKGFLPGIPLSTHGRDRITAFIAFSVKILNDEAMKTYRLMDWDNVSLKLMNDRGNLLSRLIVAKHERHA